MKAYIHSSYASLKGVESNERLEFLGDSVLNFLITDFLYTTYPKLDEGKMTTIKSYVVSTDALYKCAIKMELQNKLLVQNPIEPTKKMLADTFEAVLGETYLNSGIEAVKPLIKDLYDMIIHNKIETNWKTKVQTLVQSKGDSFQYKLTGDWGPDHDKIFEVALLVNDQIRSKGKGSSIKLAQKDAAKNFMQEGIKNVDPN